MDLDSLLENLFGVDQCLRKNKYFQKKKKKTHKYYPTYGSRANVKLTHFAINNQDPSTWVIFVRFYQLRIATLGKKHNIFQVYPIKTHNM